MNIYIYILFFLCGIFIYYIINNIDKLDVGDDQLIIGGWCMCAYDNMPYFDSSIHSKINTIIPAGHQSDVNIYPFMDEFYHDDSISLSKNLNITLKKCKKDKLNEYTYNWLGIGGQDVEGNCLDFKKIKTQINKYNYNGLAFDMESCINDNNTNNIDNVLNFIDKYKNDFFDINTKFKFIYIPNQDKNCNHIKNNASNLFKKHIDYVAPMLYTGPSSYNSPNYLSNNINNWLNNWENTLKYIHNINDNMSKKKIILTIQMYSASFNKNASLVIDFMKDNYNNYAGILGWPITYDKIQNSNGYLNNKSNIREKHTEIFNKILN